VGDQANSLISAAVATNRPTPVAVPAVFPFDQLRRRIQQVVAIAVDLRDTGQHQLCGTGLIRPTSEKVERCRETPEAKGMSHGPFLGLDVFEIRQLLQVGAQLNG
jgi:hypothetical protein